MGARESDLAEKKPEEASSEAPAAAPAEAKTEFKDGEVPAVAEVAPAAAAAATASEQAFGEAKPKGNTSQLDRGVHYWEDYQSACIAANDPEKAKPEWRYGHTEAKGWKQPHEKKKDYEFSLKSGHSASEAIQAWLAGPTIADYRTLAVATELDELRSEVGDQRFDQMFGSSDAQVDAHIPKGQHLSITPGMYGVPHIELAKAKIREREEVEKQPEEPKPAAVVEARVEEKPKSDVEELEPAVVAQELGLEQQDRQLV
jgi:hypothetical protein